VAELLGDQKKYYDYYLEAYEAVLGGLLGSYAVKAAGGEWKADYGLKAFCPVAAGCGYSHYQDFGSSRTFGYKRRHLGNDLMGSLGTPIAAVEGGTVEALGWNRYGGWRVGIRSFDGKRYYYYAHLRKDAPYAPGLQEGDTVQAGDIIGFMGRTGYSDTENTNNIDIVHLHFGLELIFDESQKDSDQEIWVDVYPIVELLSRHRVTVVQDESTGAYRRAYDYVDLDRETLPT
jgi:murein DD-endopeptidase MepM/ murein hydrolase activator NlpD